MEKENKIIYEANTGSDGRPYVSGPGNGLSRDAGTLYPELRLSTIEDAKSAARIAQIAHKQGYLAAQRDIRVALGL